MKIYYCITYHNEPQEICNSLLSSLNSQKDVDFDKFVFLLGKSSGGGEFPDLSPYENIKDRFTFISKRTYGQGPGFTHQMLLDYVYTLSDSDDDYIAFAHVDDALASEHSLRDVIWGLKTFPKAHSITFSHKFTDEVARTETIVDSRIPWEIWATIYQVSHLREKNIHFPKTFMLAEDIFFSCCLGAFWDWSTNVFIPKLVYYHYIRRKSHESLSQFEFSKISPEQGFKERIIDFTREYAEWRKTVTNPNDFLYFTWLNYAYKDPINRLENLPDSFKEGLEFVDSFCQQILKEHKDKINWHQNSIDFLKESTKNIPFINTSEDSSKNPV